MTYSKTHQRFSNYLRQPDALTNPEKYLGPNYQDVLNFWIYIDTLSDQEREKMWQLYFALDDGVQRSAIADAKNAAGEVVGEDFRRAAWDVTELSVLGYATCELIGSHKFLEQGKTLTFLPFCIKP